MCSNGAIVVKKTSLFLCWSTIVQGTTIVEDELLQLRARQKRSSHRKEENAAAEQVAPKKLPVSITNLSRVSFILFWHSLFFVLILSWFICVALRTLSLEILLVIKEANADNFVVQSLHCKQFQRCKLSHSSKFMLGTDEKHVSSSTVISNLRNLFFWCCCRLGQFTDFSRETTGWNGCGDSASSCWKSHRRMLWGPAGH